MAEKKLSASAKQKEKMVEAEADAEYRHPTDFLQDRLSGGRDPTSKHTVLKTLKIFLDQARAVEDLRARKELEQKLGRLVEEASQELAALKTKRPGSKRLTLDFKVFDDWLQSNIQSIYVGGKGSSKWLDSLV